MDCSRAVGRMRVGGRGLAGGGEGVAGGTALGVRPLGLAVWERWTEARA